MDYDEYWAAQLEPLREATAPAVEANRAELAARALASIAEEWRENDGLTPEQTAQRAGVDAETWLLWEEGAHDPTPHVARIAAGLGVAVEQLQRAVDLQGTPQIEDAQFAAFQVVMAGVLLEPLFDAALDGGDIDRSKFLEAADLVRDAALVLGDLPDFLEGILDLRRLVDEGEGPDERPRLRLVPPPD
jgi:transcriptional regulator with XRE-family HTH domain